MPVTAWQLLIAVLIAAVIITSTVGSSTRHDDPSCQVSTPSKRIECIISPAVQHILCPRHWETVRARLLNVTRLTHFWFTYCPHLRHLQLLLGDSADPLQQLDGITRGLSGLISLSAESTVAIRSGQISRERVLLPPNLFAHTPRLQRLTIRHLPQLRVLQPTSFQPTCPASLSIMDLSMNGLLHSLDLQALFHTCTNISLLNLSYNKLRALLAPGLGASPLAALRSIQLQHNHLAALPAPYFALLAPNLRELNLAHNQLSTESILGGLRGGLARLERLSLAHNLLGAGETGENGESKGGELDLTAFLQPLPQLRVLNLSGNRLVSLRAAGAVDGRHGLQMLVLVQNPRFLRLDVSSLVSLDRLISVELDPATCLSTSAPLPRPAVKLFRQLFAYGKNGRCERHLNENASRSWELDEKLDPPAASALVLQPPPPHPSPAIATDEQEQRKQLLGDEISELGGSSAATRVTERYSLAAALNHRVTLPLWALVLLGFALACTVLSTLVLGSCWLLCTRRHPRSEKASQKRCHYHHQQQQQQRDGLWWPCLCHKCASASLLSSCSLSQHSKYESASAFGAAVAGSDLCYQAESATGSQCIDKLLRRQHQQSSSVGDEYESESPPPPPIPVLKRRGSDRYCSYASSAASPRASAALASAATTLPTIRRFSPDVSLPRNLVTQDSGHASSSISDNTGSTVQVSGQLYEASPAQLRSPFLSVDENGMLVASV